MDICVLASGSSGNCIYVKSPQSQILIDVGISKKRISECLTNLGTNFDGIDAIFITHEHIDHIKALGVINRAFNIPVYCTNGTLQGIKNYDLGKVDYSKFKTIKCYDKFKIKDIQILPISTSHDALESCAFKITDSKSSLAIVTDLGIIDELTVKYLLDLNAIVLETNHDIKMLETGIYPYPLKVRVSGPRGHLSNEQAGELLNKIVGPSLKTIILAHLSLENNYDELALETLKLELELDKSHSYCFDDFEFVVAKREEPTPVISI